MEIVSIILGATSLALAVWSMVRANKSSKQSDENAKAIQGIISQSKDQLQDVSSFFTRFQIIKSHLNDRNNKEKYQQEFLDLCKDEFIAKQQGMISQEMLNMFVDTACGIVKKDPSFLTVWKKHAQYYDQDFVSFFDNKVFRTVGLI
jgi:hypothetical protein